MSSKTDKKSFSLESLAFRRLPKEDKYLRVIEFCKKHSQTPRTYKRPEDERVLGQFLVNTRALTKKNSSKVEDWEIAYLEEISKYEVYQKDPIARLKEILKWTLKNEKTPSQSSSDATEKKLGQSLNSLKLSKKKDKLAPEGVKILEKILEYKTNHQRTRAEKLADVLEFCRNQNRTPKQHVRNKHEKRLAEFLTTTKGLLKDPEFKLDRKSKKLYEEILKFAPPTRESRINELYEYANKYRKKPLTSSDDENESRMAAFLSKMKSALKRNQLTKEEHQKVSEILKLLQIKTREEKLKELKEWVTKNNSLPTINSSDKEEKRIAMFLNNMKQTQKKRPKSLSADEKEIIKEIFSFKKQGV